MSLRVVQRVMTPCTGDKEHAYPPRNELLQQYGVALRLATSVVRRF